MRTRRARVLVAVATAMLVLPTAALAQGGGGGGGGGTGDIFADLVVNLRAEDGTPILTSFEVPAEGEEPATNEYCVQPISYTEITDIDSTTNPVDGREVWLVPLMGELDELPGEAEVEVCDPQPDYATDVSEVELERLNLVRTSPDVIASKLAVVEARLAEALAITLDGAGRLTTDGVAIDAAPEHAAIYQEILRTGTIPGLAAYTGDGVEPGPPAQVGVLDAWQLAAVSMGSAAGKGVPLSIDAVQYYHRIIPFPAADYMAPAEWPMSFVQSADPDTTDAIPAPDERFVNFGDFTYTRSELFPGSVTWLHTPTLTWHVDRILDIVPFGNLTAMADIDDVELEGVLGYAQMVDDVRSVILYYHNNEVIEGFYFDAIGADTTEDQEAALLDPSAVNRTGGQDRVETAILLSQERFEDDSANVAVIANSLDFPDALSAVPLTKKLNAPLLITSSPLDDRVLEEAQRAVVDGGSIVFVGGTAVMPEAMADEFEAVGLEVTRYSGADRYATAVAVARAIGSPDAVMLTTGRNFPDALAAGPAAARMNGVVILTNDSVMPSVSADYLAEVPAAPQYAVGGPAALAAPSAEGVVGVTRYDTAARVAERFFEYPFGVGVASGLLFPDAVSGGADAAAQEWPLLLTPTTSLSPYTAVYIESHPSVVSVDVYGGEGAIAESVIVELYDALG